MMLEIVHGQPENLEATGQLADLTEVPLAGGKTYLGYPLLPTTDDRVEIDALVVPQAHDLIAFRSTRSVSS